MSNDQGSQLTQYDSALFWFRRDLRDHDNAGLFYALRHSKRVYCAFIFDRDILDALPSRQDRRVEFIWESLRELQTALISRGGDLIVWYDRACTALPKLAQQLDVQAVFTNEDYEPQTIERDAHVASALKQQGRAFHAFKDQVIFAKDEVLTQSGGTFSVFTPYKNAWLKKFNGFHHRPYDVDRYAQHLAKPPFDCPLMPLEAMRFERTNLKALSIATGMSGASDLMEDFASRMKDYKQARDFPGVKGVSYLSVHNRFGTCSIRALVNRALRGRGDGAQTWLSELIWRDFYFQILFHHPRVVNGAFKPEYDALKWPNDERLFAAWCEARTGYPVIDAAMRQINQTGYMHNRLRMIVASFLTKDLLIDWRWGEKYFADHLNDFDLAANNGGWQWAASTGCDAQPYFRIFNPVTQSERFDPQGKFIRRYLPELTNVPDKYIHAPWALPPIDQQHLGCVIGKHYPAPVVEHAVQRERALAMYKQVKSTQST